MLRCVLLLGVLPPLALLTLCVAQAAREGDLCETVKPSATYPGALRASEVCMRSLGPRPLNARDPYNTLQAARAFHVTRLEWTYGLKPEFMVQARAAGLTVAGACNNMSLSGLDTKVPEWYKRYSALDLAGNAVEAPWMRDWPGHALWHCVNNPEAREAYLRYVKSQVDLGVADLQRDDPTMNYNATNWGGCFCPYCVAGFREYLRQHGDKAQLTAAGVTDPNTFDYAAYLRAKGAPVGDAFRQYPRDYLKGQFIDFQEQSTLEFHRWWRQELNDYAKRYVPVSSNNGLHDHGAIHRLFDYWIGELNWTDSEPETLYENMREVLALGKGQTVTMPLRREATVTPEWIARIRQTIATSYALGMHIEAPWDTYLPILGETPARFFGNPADYADLFALVRARAALLDGYELAAATGGSLEDPDWPANEAPVMVIGPSSRVFAFTRALPGQAQAPVVVHLVDCSAQPRPFTISLNPAVLFGGKPLRLSLITPRPYDETAHNQAADSGDFASLVQQRVLGEGKLTACELPPLSPWGLLVIQPLAASQAPWAPRMVLAESQGTVSLTGLDQGATVRFTTDGTVPGPDAPAARGPVPLAGLKELQARSFRGNTASAVTLLRTFPRPGQGPKELLVNGDFAQGTTGWTPVVMEPLEAEALAFVVEKAPTLQNVPAARLTIRASDGVPYHLRLTQPVSVPAGATVQFGATLVADRPTQIRLGLQEVSPPHRVVAVRVLEIGPQPTRVRVGARSQHPDLLAQYQLDLGYAAAGTTVWLAGASVRLRTDE